MNMTFLAVFLGSWGIQFALTRALPSSRFQTYQKFFYYGVFLAGALAMSLLMPLYQYCGGTAQENLRRDSATKAVTSPLSESLVQSTESGGEAVL